MRNSSSTIGKAVSKAGKVSELTVYLLMSSRLSEIINALITIKQAMEES